jgi:hypothetical protein
VGREGEGGGEGGRERGERRGGRCVRADASAFARTHCRVCADVVFTVSADGKNPSAG